MSDDARWRIEDLAEKAGVSVYTLRFYQRQRLLPSGEQNGKAKWYGPEHLARLQQIRDLQLQGFSLAAIRVVLDESTAHVWGLFTAANDEQLNRDELVERTGASEALVDGLVAIGALGDPRRATPSARSFDAADLRLLEHVKTLNDSGLPDAVVVAMVDAAVHHLEALSRQTSELLFGEGGDWTADEQDSFKTHLVENIESVREAVAWMVRFLQLRSAQRLALSSADDAGSARRPARQSRRRAQAG